MDRHEWDERYDTSDLVWRSEPNMFLPPEVAGSEPGTALDLACGEGRNSVWLAQQGWRVTGVDFSERGIAKARDFAAERGVDVELVAADLLEWDPSPGVWWDLVVIFYLHLPAHELREVYRRAVSAMAPGATLLIVGHDLANLTQGWGGPKDPAVLLDPEAIVADLAPYPDVVIERAARVRRPVTTTDADGNEIDTEAIDCFVRAHREQQAATG